LQYAPTDAGTPAKPPRIGAGGPSSGQPAASAHAARRQGSSGVSEARPPTADVRDLNGVPYADLIQRTAARYGLDPALLAALTRAESNFNPRAVSHAGAQGLTQLMPATARGLGVTDPFDPAQNLDGGARFLSDMLRRYHGDANLAIAAYNAGPGAVDRYGGIPPYAETQRHVAKVQAYRQEYRVMSDE
jgi:soluble lytic murein transglycosylase-like protein